MLPLFQNLREILERWPGIGPKTAERFVFYLLKQPKEELTRLIGALTEARDQSQTCGVCYNVATSNPCPLCADQRRESGLICVVAEPQDVLAIEKTNEFQGLYHVLGGTLDAPGGITPRQLKIQELINRLQAMQQQGQKTELILGLNANIEGETTMLYLTQLLKPLKITITRLARGLPQGSDLQYADEITLSNALKERREV